ncbi:hypothetical protein CL630_03860 [bacterium]|mgnify:CR=1 FL=1|nr:hypothetical protein [bacterium]|tara:strand:- start:52579 stop:52791 length:213 start_codon:yes stop_codon:yes gene_type:complete
MIEISSSFISLTLGMVGTVFIAYAALRVHHRVLGEHKIDEKVLKTMRIEQIVGWAGVSMVVAGYAITIFS